ncbi:hypothetical protein SPRG_19785 [Saprolegnia parasitica CBS 223.65]|uniref:Solute carrier family 40 member n=1 Tax=Saprolegnia parasitica (strain CBS 223.65) TaxID=695850 RepID=A0A067CHN5_SAPPC|nr:hypothetical protein SPRG_19785 [Saprolegnia parasitica CBS 223.65]KDO30229.1 hypothetical protein SPRG_19785 [Saprolegnia parasitica CBS 223.65]|eukprot:XP_012199038.1 hypothetical protein SPRG_19785 [Saprolegnia parasitica CBS 223.65]
MSSGQASLAVGAIGLMLLAGSLAAPAMSLVPTAVVVPLGIVGATTVGPIAYYLWIGYQEASAFATETSPLLGSRLTDAMGRNVARRLRACLYVGRFFSAWGDRMWQFATPLLFMEIYKDTLLPSALFSLVVYVVGLVALPRIGRWLDATNRLSVLARSIAIENTCVVLSTTSLASLLLVSSPAAAHILLALTMLAGAIGQVFNDAQALAIEKDWVVVVAAATQTPLASWNTTLRRIDLTCALLAPAVFGILLDSSSADSATRAAVGAAAVGTWNLLAAPLEYAMVRDVYAWVPTLSASTLKVTAAPASETLVAQWAAYTKHPTCLLSVSFCALYMTVLCGSGLNIAYLQWRGLPVSLLGASAGLGALAGLVGTLVFPALERSWGAAVVVLVSIWLFWLTLLPVGVSYIAFGETRTTDIVMVVAVTVSRAWLWMTDLAETQLMQERVHESMRGAINAMQTATSKIFYIAILLLSVLCSDPAAFETLAFVSLGAVGSAALGMSIWFAAHGRSAATAST